MGEEVLPWEDLSHDLVRRARLGGEVRGFQSLPNVDLAIGVDLEPGEKNERAPSMCRCAWRVSTARVQYRVGAWCDVMT